MQRPLMLWPLVLCLLILSIGGGFAGGIMMLMDPSGEMLGVAETLPLLPVPNFILPGIFLLVVMGIFPLILAITLITRPDWPWFDSLFQWSNHYWAWTSTLILVAILVAVERVRAGRVLCAVALPVTIGVEAVVGRVVVGDGHSLGVGEDLDGREPVGRGIPRGSGRSTPRASGASSRAARGSH